WSYTLALEVRRVVETTLGGHDNATTRQRDNGPIILLEDVHKWFGKLHVLRGITVKVWPGEVVVVAGPSGSGKSTMIRCINRLESHQRSRIVVDGIELTDDVHNIDAVRSEVGMVFQSFNLCPPPTALKNVSLAPVKARKWPKHKADGGAVGLLERVGTPNRKSTRLTPTHVS